MTLKKNIKLGMAALIIIVICPGLSADEISDASCGPMIYGDWVTDDGVSIVTIQNCEKDKICGQLSYLGDSVRDALDDMNKDPDLRSRRLLGSELLTNFSAKGTNKYEGKIYNPRNGKSYKSIIETDDGNVLNVKGCVGPFCETQIWTRPEECRATEM